MEIHILSVDLERHDISTRMPFKYGIATMTYVPHLFVRIEARFDGVTQKGISADHLPPKWFTKEPEKDPLEEIDDMLKVIEKAGELARKISGDSVFDAWQQLYQAQDAWAQQEGVPSLLAHFGTSLIERALIDAFCRFQNSTFPSLLQDNAFGIEWDSLRPELAGLQPKDLLSAPLPSVIARHTVGMADPLAEDDIPEDERLNDGLPQSLEACIQFYGVRHLKIKVNGILDKDIERLEAIEALITKLGLKDVGFTLDGNEQFKDVDSFRTFWNALQTSERMRSFFKQLIFVEQPFHRELALTDEIGIALKAWEDAPPIIIDESDASLDSAPRALELGYKGTSHKNCKGVFKGILNRCLINFKNQEAGREQYLMSGEDLANIGPVANHLDLVVQATLGIESVERNGHHYFTGLSVFNDEIQANALNSFPSLYTREKDYVRLNIHNGRLDLSELLDTPFGTDESHF
ncbi:MAG: hypothetical protein P8L44_24360 [Opitutales bacterium]|nr:hypothetical protein [Opitutales bacterium]